MLTWRLFTRKLPVDVVEDFLARHAEFIAEDLALDDRLRRLVALSFEYAELIEQERE